VLGPDSPALLENRVSSVQTISGTGANHLGALFLSRFYRWTEGEEKVGYLSDPTWVNHFQILSGVGIKPVTYPYYDPKTIGLAFDKYLATLKSAPPRSVFVLHACAHNPTGVDPTREQWLEIADVVLERKHYVFFDCAYQGFASGDLDADAWAIREFVNRGIPLLICQVHDAMPISKKCTKADGGGRYVLRVSQKMRGCMVSALERCISSRRMPRRLYA